MEQDTEYKSKTQIKKQALELQKLGEELARLSPAELKSIGLPKDLLKALLDSKSITSHIAARRQRQYIGALMRTVDSEPVLEALNRIKTGAPLPLSEDDMKCKKWMSQLLSEDNHVIEEFINAYPHIQRQQLRQLLRNIHKEISSSKPAKSKKALEKLVLSCVRDSS